ncbi:MAG: right-handed parallel beta-helix repeat-containing protein [Spirochaetia bacterium]|nr:right-handed parallel beta-helix repeat-containing protein [Spirochaetia bacterium]
MILINESFLNFLKNGLAAGAFTLASVFAGAISPDDPLSVQREIDAAFKAGLKKIVIPAGVYRLPRPESLPWHLRFFGLKDLEIDATGVTFIFTGRDKRSVMFDNCTNVTFRGATLLREIPPFSQGKIQSLAEDRTSVQIKIDPGYPTDLDDPRYFHHHPPVIDLYQTGTQKLKPLVPDLYIANVERLGPDLFRFIFRAALHPAIPVAVGDAAAWRGKEGGDLGLWECERMRMENITLKNGMGLAFTELGGEGGNLWKNCTITYAEKPAGATDLPLIACATDGFNSGATRVGPTLENCLFEGLNDDSVNIHGSYGMVAEAGEKKIVADWRNPHRAAKTPIPLGRPGDTLRFYDRKGSFCGEAVVVSAKAAENYSSPDLGKIDSRVFSDRSKAIYWEISLDRAVKAVSCGVVANPSQTGRGFVVRNCTFRNSRAHGIFIRADKGLIEGSTVEGLAMAGIVIAPELSSWNEADYSRGIVIRSNTIRNVALGTQPWNSGLTVAAFEFGGFVPLPGGHRDIRIDGNRFEDNRGPNLILTSVIGVNVIGNQFIRAMNAAAFKIENFGVDNTGALIWMRNADKVVLKDNAVTSPGSFMKTKLDVDASVNLEGGME